MSYYNEVFSYDGSTGLLTWKHRPLAHFKDVRAWKTWNTRFSGKVTCGVGNHGYVNIGVNGVLHLGHRIIWEMLYGPIPHGMQIDHINGIRADNRQCNLRLATNGQNSRNAGTRRDSSTGVRGVNPSKGASRYRVRISVDGKNMQIGTYGSIEEAVRVRKQAEADYFGEFAYERR